MANYTGELTEKQLAALEPLERQFKSFERKINNLKRVAQENLGMDFDAAKRNKEQIGYFENERDEVKRKINSIYDAKAKYDECVNAAKILLTTAEHLSDEYGPWSKEA